MRVRAGPVTPALLQRAVLVTRRAILCGQPQHQLLQSEISAVQLKKEKIYPSRILHISIILLSFTEVMFHLTLLTMVQITSTSHPVRRLPAEMGSPCVRSCLLGYATWHCEQGHASRAEHAQCYEIAFICFYLSSLIFPFLKFGACNCYFFIAIAAQIL